MLGGAAAYSNVLALSPWTMMLNPLATVAALILFPLIMLQLLAATSYCYLFSLLVRSIGRALKPRPVG